MKFYISWEAADDDNFHFCRVLYAYLDPEDSEILYIGKADGCTVSQRYHAWDKDAVFDFIEDEYDLKAEEVDIIIGNIKPERERKFTSGLMEDIESLLIYQIEPAANIKNMQSRPTSRPGMKIICNGVWPLRRKVFIDR